MPTRVSRQTVDLSAYPDLIVVYLGMRVNRLYGIRTFFNFGRKIAQSVVDEPDGLLRHPPVDPPNQTEALCRGKEGTRLDQAATVLAHPQQ